MALTKAFFENYYHTYNSENPQALEALYADDVVFTSAQGTSHGRDAILQTYRYLIASFEDRMTPESILIDGDHAAVEITDVFTARENVPDFMGASLKKGEKLTLKLCGIYTVKDNRITQATLYAR